MRRPMSHPVLETVYEGFQILLVGMAVAVIGFFVTFPFLLPRTYASGLFDTAWICLGIASGCLVLVFFVWVTGHRGK